ncbi:hypothetical protein CSB08_01220 [Candidatus Gracilibacteria bacterium]|nr:MAG: hypothetical protein CSB08_01220 [Candidatus Gracilibacteria bacterium]PIE85409.1 MAG: hypothetical protein CSA08_02425 [Candidatus Gracilibacteria bacterium]
MYNIFIKTPLYKNSNYIAHIIEHCAIPKSNNPKEYFKNYIFSGENYIYYTNFFVNTKSEKILNNFIKNLIKPIDKKTIEYEKKVIKDELVSLNYEKKVINKIGKKIYNNEIKYSQVTRIGYKEIQNYHKKYYNLNNILVLEKSKIEKDIKIGNYKFKKVFDLKSKEGKEKVFLLNFEIQNFFITNFIAEVLEDYLYYYNRHKLGIYYSNKIFVGEFENIIFLSVSKTDIEKFLEIPKDFIKNFIKYKMENFGKIDFTELDGVSMIKFGYTISDFSKKEILININKYLVYYLENFLRNI